MVQSLGHSGTEPDGVMVPPFEVLGILTGCKFAEQYLSTTSSTSFRNR